jgi:DNA-binding transcriptional ArsR family regulator
MQMFDELSTTFAALADPTRRAILARLSEGEATVNQLAEPFHLKLPTISKHLKVLQHAGLVTQGRKAQWRPCRLETAPLEQVGEWVDRYRRIWAERFGQLDDYLADLQREEKKRGRKK